MLHFTSTGKQFYLLNGPLKKRPFQFSSNDGSHSDFELETFTLGNAAKMSLEGEEKNFPLRSLPTLWNLAILQHGQKELKEHGPQLIHNTKLLLQSNQLNFSRSTLTYDQLTPLKRSRKFINLHAMVSTPFSYSPLGNGERGRGLSLSTVIPSVLPDSGMKRKPQFPVTTLDCPVLAIPYTFDLVNTSYTPSLSRSWGQRGIHQYPHQDKKVPPKKVNVQLELSLACNFCDKSYRSLCALKMHIQTHTRPFMCQICRKCFSRPWLLQGHLRTHTGEKPFSCRQCERAFADRSNLRAHLQTHTKNKRYLCKKCSKSFSRMSLLLKHQQKCM